MGILGLEAISTFSLSHLIYVAVALVLAVLFSLIFLKAGNTAKKVTVFVFSLIGLLSLVGIFVYNYLTITFFDVASSLPLNLSGICFIVATIFVLTKVNFMKSFVGYAGIFTGLYGLLALPFDVLGQEVFDIYTLMYFIPYIILFVVGCLTFTLKLVRPKFKYVAINSIMLVAFSGIGHLANILLEKTQITPWANYFMTMDAGRDKISKLLYSYIKMDFVYLAGYLAVFVVLSSIISLFGLRKKTISNNVETVTMESSQTVEINQTSQPVDENELSKTDNVPETAANSDTQTENNQEVGFNTDENPNVQQGIDIANLEASLDDIIIKDEEVAKNNETQLENTVINKQTEVNQQENVSTDLEKPDLSFDNNKPDLSFDDAKPDLSFDEKKPDLSFGESKPVENVEIPESQVEQPSVQQEEVTSVQENTVQNPEINVEQTVEKENVQEEQEPIVQQKVVIKEDSATKEENDVVPNVEFKATSNKTIVNTSIERKTNSFSDAERRRRMEAIGASVTKKKQTSNKTDLLKDLRDRINRLGTK